MIDSSIRQCVMREKLLHIHSPRTTVGRFASSNCTISLLTVTCIIQDLGNTASLNEKENVHRSTFGYITFLQSYSINIHLYTEFTHEPGSSTERNIS
jgi:hypothetical protein